VRMDAIVYFPAFSSMSGQRGDWPQYIGDGISGAWPLGKDKGLPVTRQATWPSAGKERGK
jgi:hypothetical protein